MMSVIVYAGMWATMGAGLYYDVMYIPVFEPGASWFRKLKFLTMLNLAFQSFYLGVATLRALMANRKRRSMLDDICDWLFREIAFPVGLTVVLLFWGIYAVDRELVFPKSLDEIIPEWLNHVMHTAPLPFIIIDSYLVNHKTPKGGARTCILLGIAYNISIYVWHFVEGVWVYPFFQVMSGTQRILFNIFATLFITGLYYVGVAVNYIFWGSKQPHVSQEKLGQYSYQNSQRGKKKAK